MWKRKAEESVLEWCSMRKPWLVIVGFEDRMCPQAEECQDPLEAGRGKKRDPFLEPPERSTALLHLDFIPMKPIVNFWLPEL